jgi:hypothetical protein
VRVALREFDTPDQQLVVFVQLILVSVMML